MNSFTCIKPTCGKVYKTEDEEAYYCESCLDDRKRIALEVDKKMAGRVTTPPKTPLQIYDEALASRGASKGGISFVNANDIL